MTRPDLIPVPPDEQPGLDDEWKVEPVTQDLRRPRRDNPGMLMIPGQCCVCQEGVWPWCGCPFSIPDAKAMWRWQMLVGR